MIKVLRGLNSKVGTCMYVNIAIDSAKRNFLAILLPQTVLYNADQINSFLDLTTRNAI